MRKTINILIMICICLGLLSCDKKEETETNVEVVTEKQINIEKIDRLPDGQFQAEVIFPDHLGEVDDTLAMNSMYSFEAYENQGDFYLISKADEFDLYINSYKLDTSSIEKNSIYHIDFDDYALNGKNTIQVNTDDSVEIYIPYPIVIEGDYDEGFNEDALQLISDIIESDIEYGFSSAQLAIIRHGKLVYANSWGYKNSYDESGNRIEDGEPVTNDTMYDLASVTKMFATNYAIQRLVSEDKLDINDKVYEYLGEEFYEDTLDFNYDFGDNVSYETQVEWKKSLTIRDMLTHEGGFPPAPRYFNINVDAPSQDIDEEGTNVLYSGVEFSLETREKTKEAVNKTPLVYEPKTDMMYSDVDYMVLCLVVEKITGMRLDEYLKQEFFDKMDLDRITFNPLLNGYSKDDCAATEIYGNTRDQNSSFPGIRTYTLQGEVHDEMAYYSMMGISGHAGLFSSATDLAKLASVMLTGGYGNNHFFDRNVIDMFAGPKNTIDDHYGLGWQRQGDNRRTWYFGSQSPSNAIGHQGWTGTFVMIDPERDIVYVYLTNRLNTRVYDPEDSPNDFSGNYYTACSIGFVPQIFSIGLDQDVDIKPQLISLLDSMSKDSIKLVYKDKNHPSRLNVDSKLSVYKKWVDEHGDSNDKERYQQLYNNWNEQ